MNPVSGASSSLLDAIFLSEKRKNLLLLLKEEGPKSSDEIKSAFDFPWKSMIPQIKKLVDLGLVVHADGMYFLSEMGVVIATNVQFLLNTLKIYDENRDFWSEHDLSPIPFHLLIRIGELGQCKVLNPDLSHIFKVQEDIVKCMLASSRIMVFTSAIHPAYHLLCLEFLEKKIDVTIILTESVFEGIQSECLPQETTSFSDSSVLKLELPEYKKEVQFFLTCDNSHFFVSDGEKKPMMLVVTDKIFALSLLDKNNRIDRNYLVSFEPGALKWGEELFEYYKQNSLQLRFLWVLPSAEFSTFVFTFLWFFSNSLFSSIFPLFFSLDMKVRDENYHHVLFSSFFPIIAIIPLIIVILSSTENISVSTIFLFLAFPFSYPVSSSYISSSVIRCHIIVVIFLARAIIAFVCPIDFFFLLKNSFNLLFFFLAAAEQSEL